MPSIGTTRAEDDFFDAPKEWSHRKHRILAGYLKTYLKIRGRSHQRFFYVDGYAGSGLYGVATGVESAGSPIIVAEIAENVATSDVPYSFHCIAVEYDQGRYNQLCRALQRYPHAHVDPRQGEFATHLPDILAQLGRAPAFFFLDPFGLKDIQIDTIEQLLKRDDTELLMMFNSWRLRMLAGNEDSDAPEARGKVELVSKLLGEDPDLKVPEWMERYRTCKTPDDTQAWVDWAVKRYARNLKRRSTHLQHVVDLPVRKRFGARPSYHLLFATRSDKAVQVMNDFCVYMDEDLETKSWIKPGGQQPLSFVMDFREKELSNNADQIREEIYRWGLTQNVTTPDQVFQHMAILRPGQYSTKYYRTRLRELESDGRVVYDPSDKGKKDYRAISFAATND